MTAKEIPTYRCTSCLHALTADDHQHLFASYSTKPTSDEADNFVSEAQTILRYAADLSLAKTRRLDLVDAPF